MKKNMKKLVALMIVLVLAFAFSGCGKKGFAGKYSLTGIEAMGMKMDVKEYAEQMGMGDVDISLTLKDDGVCTLDLTAMGETETQEGTWEEKDGKLFVTSDGDTMEAKVDGGNIILEQDGIKMIFKK